MRRHTRHLAAPSGGLSPLLCAQPQPCVSWEAWTGEAHTHCDVLHPCTRMRVGLILCRTSGPLEWRGRSLRSSHAVRSQAPAPADLHQQAREAGSASPLLGYRSRTRPEPVLTLVSRHRSAVTLGGSSLERPTEPLREPCSMTCGLTLSEVVTVAPLSTAGKCSIQVTC